MRLKPRKFQVTALLLASLGAAGCNMYSQLDESDDRADQIEQGRYDGDDGDCVTARDRLANITPLDDDQRFSLGFAHLCVGGATLENIGATVANYTTGSGTDYTLVGNLARRLLPYSVSKNLQISQGTDVFRDITTPNRRAYASLVGHLARLAIITARAAGDRTTLVRDDISLEANCTSVAACTAAGMTDADATEFKTEVLTMAADASSISLPGLADLAAGLNSTFAGLATADAVRFYVRTSVVPAN